MPVSQICFAIGVETTKERDLFARLEDERVATGERRREHPERHHHGKVKGRDAGADAEREIDRLAIDAAREVAQRIAEEQRGNAAGVFDVLEAAEDRAARLGVRLAVFARDGVAELVEVLLHQLPKTEKQACAFDGWRVAPRGKRRGGGLDCGVHLDAAASRALGDHVAGGGIEDGCAAGIRREPFAGDIVGAGEES